MAKKKTEASGTTPAPKKPVRRLKKKAEAAAAAPAGTPMIDTGLAAMSAARMLAAKAKLGNAAATAGNKETSTFKHLKESLNKPAASLASSALGSNLGPQKSNLPTGLQGQVVHNQTQGGVRFNVPRRTAG
ncbi:MAG TPA: hypothetical protein VHP11_00285 [Tepidisphaeraceae bacterium]|nr:hypothetical protein [Tepidisphaeraceae bacterium]